MKASAIENALHKMPFRPFTLTQDTGRVIRVVHPDCLLFNGAKNACVVTEGREDFHVLELSHLSRLSYKIPLGRRRSRKNGRS